MNPQKNFNSIPSSSALPQNKLELAFTSHLSYASSSARSLVARFYLPIPPARCGAAK
jgi:hypothetical protein